MFILVRDSISLRVNDSAALLDKKSSDITLCFFGTFCVFFQGKVKCQHRFRRFTIPKSKACYVYPKIEAFHTVRVSSRGGGAQE